MSVRAQLAEDFSQIVEGFVETNMLKLKTLDSSINCGIIHLKYHYESSNIDYMNIKLPVYD